MVKKYGTLVSLHANFECVVRAQMKFCLSIPTLCSFLFTNFYSRRREDKVLAIHTLLSRFIMYTHRLQARTQKHLLSPPSERSELAETLFSSDCASVCAENRSIR